MPQDNSIGAMWVKQGKSGPFYSGYVEVNGQRVEIIAFKNDNSKNPKAPSLRILKSTPRPTSTPSNPAMHGSGNIAPAHPMAEVNPDEIPF